MVNKQLKKVSMNVFIFLCCLLAVIFGSTENAFGYVVEAVSEEIPPLAPVSGNLSCTSQQTECALGCCPYPNAVCCTDGYECCPQGKVCVSYVGICIGLENEQNKELALVSSKTTPVENLRTPCPSGTTTCGPNRCCPFPNGVCCLDGEHCCPNGYRCDLSKLQCIKNSNDIYTTFSIPATSSKKSFEPFKTVKEDPYKSCPGGTRQCPSYMSCCLNDDNVWSCCPNPKLLQYKKKGENLCCMTAMGYICCPFGCNYYFGCV